MREGGCHVDAKDECNGGEHGRPRPGYARLSVAAAERCVRAWGRDWLHSHKARPAFSYILEGTLTVGQEGGNVREYTPAEVITESRDVTHWGENRRTSKVVIVSVDIIKKP